ncbi:hypothetical protein [Pseudomonas sp. PDM17]|uniref:hypothetical protein n=1 Tax=unclassified Pseudomonas TaxID=196821 RepID=UPI00399A2016
MVNIKHEALVHRIQPQETPWNCKLFFSHLQESAERQPGAGNLPTLRIQHDFLEAAKTFVLEVADVTLDERICAQQLGAETGMVIGGYAVMALVHTEGIAIFNVHGKSLKRCDDLVVQSARSASAAASSRLRASGSPVCAIGNFAPPVKA